MVNEVIIGRLPLHLYTEMTPEQLLEYTELFSGKNWAKDDANKMNYLFERISLLKDEEQEKLVLYLTEKFEYITLVELMSGLQDAFVKCVKQITCKENILVSPLKNPFVDDRRKKSPDGEILFTKAKSPDLIYPLLKISLTDETLLDIVHFCDDPLSLIKKFKPGQTIVILVDDFVGSGLTTQKNIDAYVDLLSQYKLESSQTDFCVVVEIAMKQGIENLAQLGIECFANKVQGKGISDDSNFSEEQIKTNICMMKNIESKILDGLNPKFSLGFEESESLVSIMNKAPNNTFPFYWGKCIGGAKPVFRRYYE